MERGTLPLTKKAKLNINEKFSVTAAWEQSSDTHVHQLD